MPTHTIAENLQRLQTAKTAIGNAIVAKGGTVGANDGLEEYPADIATIPSGGIEPASPKDVNFYDYDGTCVYSYTADEFAELTEMPANPSHSGLTAQGWNWSLADAKAYVGKYEKLKIGQMYATSDGTTRIYIQLQDSRREPYLKLYLSDNSEVDVDWGDGSTHSTFTSTTADYVGERHTYATGGNYVISIKDIRGSYSLQNSRNSVSTLLTNNESVVTSPDKAYLNAIKKIELSSHITTLNRAIFDSCCSLKAITIPKSVTGIGVSTFSSCASLSTIVIPDGFTGLSTYCFLGCGGLANIVLNYGLQNVGASTFSNNPVLGDITLPDSITGVGSNVFSNNGALTSIIFPDSVAEIAAGAFSGCTSLAYIKFSSSAPPTIGNINAWANIPSDCYILVPLGKLDDYLNETNMLDDSVYMYLCYAKYASGAELPTTSTDGYTLTWYATKDDARNAVNPITVGNGKEVYAVGA